MTYPLMVFLWATAVRLNSKSRMVMYLLLLIKKGCFLELKRYDGFLRITNFR